MVTASAETALRHLRTVKPSDGWSVEKSENSRLVRLRRRNVPLTNSFFSDIHFDSKSGCVVGILSCNSSGSCQSQILVNKTGRPTGSEIRLLKTQTYRKAPCPKAPPRSETEDVVNDEQNRRMLVYGLYAFGVLIILRSVRVLFSSLLSVIALPLIYLFLCNNCPTIDSFDAKKELKRIMRGHHLPEGHPNKPKGWFNETVARVQASLAAEVTTSLGYDVEMQNIGGALIVAMVRVPASESTHYWVGALNSWWFIYSTRREQSL